MPSRRTWPMAAVLVAACHSAPPAEVAISGDPRTMSHLAGEWSGSYQSGATGRSGSIVFTLVPGENQARGDVVMVPRGANLPLRPARGQGMGADSTNQPQVLTIEFIRAARDSVSGTLAPYVDPDCNCSTSTSFYGRVRGNVISGTFTATQQGRSLNGTWEVRRRG